MRMNKNILREYLCNALLMQVIEQKKHIDETCKGLIEAIRLLNQVDSPASVLEGVQGKLNEYQDISKGYSNMLEDVWGLSWQTVSVIRRYLDSDGGTLDHLPEYISYA